MTRYGCLVVGFRRQLELQTVLDSIRNESFDEYFVSVDGADDLTPELFKQNADVKHFATDYMVQNSLSWNLILRDRRLGIVTNFISSIDEAFAKVDFLVILEDDCVPAKGILDYCKSVERLRQRPDILMLTFFRPELAHLQSGCFLTHNPLMWGWGISRENWNDVKGAINEISWSRGFAKGHRLFLQSFYLSGFRKAISGEKDALDAIIAYYLLMTDSLVLGPPTNMISNIGFGGHATNTYVKNRFMGVPTKDWGGFESESEEVISSDLNIWKTDFAIARQMNDWKFHHVISNVLKINYLRLLNLFLP